MGQLAVAVLTPPLGQGMRWLRYGKTPGPIRRAVMPMVTGTNLPRRGPPGLV